MEYVACNLCGSNRTRLVFSSTIPDRSRPQDMEAYRCTSSGYGRHHAIVQCSDCGLVYSNPRWDDSELMNSYEAVQDPLYLQEREGRVLTFERHLRPLEKLTGPANGTQAARRGMLHRRVSGNRGPARLGRLGHRAFAMGGGAGA